MRRELPLDAAAAGEEMIAASEMEHWFDEESARMMADLTARPRVTYVPRLLLVCAGEGPDKRTLPEVIFAEFGPAQKSLAAAGEGAAAQGDQPVLAVLTCEVWGVRGTSREGLGGLEPRYHPLREEAILVAAMTIDRRALSRVWPMRRGKKRRIILGEPEPAMRSGEASPGSRWAVMEAFWDGFQRGYLRAHPEFAERLAATARPGPN